MAFRHLFEGVKCLGVPGSLVQPQGALEEFRFPLCGPFSATRAPARERFRIRWVCQSRDQG